MIENPKGAEARVQQSIDAGLEGERQPARPVGGIAKSKFINPPPLIAPTWFQNRHVETAQIGDFLKDESLRLMTVVGRGGVGKTAMVCRLLRSLESGRLPDDGGALAVDGIVYLSAARSFHRTNVPDLYASLIKLLPDESVKQLDSIYKNPQASTQSTMEALVNEFPSGRTVVLLDNFEDMLEVETGKIKDTELNDALRALLKLPPHGLKIIITSRVTPSELLRVEPGLQRKLHLDTGLDYPYAERILRAMDADGKIGLRDAPDSLLAKARERTRGYPRALEHLFGILAADRDTSLQEILDNTEKYLPEEVVAVLVGEAFSRLDLTAQRVMQALATYRYPVPPAAVDYLLQPHVPGIDSSPVLGRLLNMQFVRRDAGHYYLHQVDRDYALSRIAQGSPADRAADTPPLTRFGLRHRAAEWFRLSRKPREAWKTLGDLAAQLSEFELRCDGDDFDTAAAVLLEFDFSYLFVWGHYRLMSELHERLQGKVKDPALAESSLGNLGSAYYRMGEVEKAISFYERALQLARERKSPGEEATWLCNLGAAIFDRGENACAIRYFEQSLKLSQDISDRKGQSNSLGNLATSYATMGQISKAADLRQQALDIDREITDRENEAFDLRVLGGTRESLGQTAEALRCCREALQIAQEIGYRLVEADAHATIGTIHLSQSKWKEAKGEFEQALEIADDIGNAELSKETRHCMALVNLFRGDLSEARQMAEAARKYDSRLRSGTNSAILGLVALRQGEVKEARAAFAAAVKQCGELIDLCADRYEALDNQGLALCGLALCGDRDKVAEAKNAYASARALTSDLGITSAVLQQFDALAQADDDGILAEVRPFAAGQQRPEANRMRA